VESVSYMKTLTRTKTFYFFRNSRCAYIRYSTFLISVVIGEANTGPGTHLIFQKTKKGMIKVESCGICLQIVKEMYNMNKHFLSEQIC
jgi:hypothetical protein